MKQLTCAQLGGPADCTAVMSGNTAEEIVQNGMQHVEEAHPEMVADIKAMTPEQTTEWMTGTQATFDAQPEM